MARPRIIVAGAGIGGLATALTLARSGHEVGLLEKRTGFGEPGAGIQLSPNATRILIGLGLEGALLRHSCEPERVAVRSLRSGAAIGQIGLGPAMRARFGAPYLSIARSDLHGVLLDAVRARPEVTLRVGRAVAHVEQAPDRVTAFLERTGGGREDIVGDALVGADGIGSAVRSALGDGRMPAYSGYAAFRTTVPIEAVPGALARPEVGLWLGRGRHVVHYPVVAGKALNIVVVARRRASPEGWSQAVEPTEAATLADAPEPLRELIAAAASWTCWALDDLPVRRMASGRVALVGDAAHPVLPYLAQGGALAVEDAAELAAHLLRTPGDIPKALRHYAAARRPRVRRVQKAARRNGRVFHAGPLLAFARDLVMRRLGPDGMGERYAWVYGWRGDTAP